MAQYPSSFLQTVQTYQRSGLGLLYNECCHVATFNKKFDNFNNKIATNLGDTVTFDKPPRAYSTVGLVASYQSANQLVHNLTVDQAFNASFPFTSQQRIFNVEKDNDDYVKVFVKSFMAELANNVETNVALNWISAVPVMTVDQNGGSVPTGALHTESGPFRFFGNGTTPLNSFNQLAKMQMIFKNFGMAVTDEFKVYLPDYVYPDIVATGLNQFVMDRNEEIASKWYFGDFAQARYHTSNLLPIHYSGNVGNNGTVLTLISTNDPTGQNVTQLTFSGCDASDQEAIKVGDMFQFNDGVSGQQDIRYLTWIGHSPSVNSVQNRVTAVSTVSAGGHVTITIANPLNWAGGSTWNLTHALAAGMQVSFLPTHRAGGIIGGNAAFLAMPQLPDQRPYDTANEYDQETGASIRLTYGSLFGKNQMGWICDEVHGSTIVPEYSMRLIIPLSQG